MFDLPDRVLSASDCPESWIRNIEIVDLWAKGQEYNMRGVNWFKLPDGTLMCSLPDKQSVTIPPQDELGRTIWDGERVQMQRALDAAFLHLTSNHPDSAALWSLDAVKRWGSKPASEKQIKLIQRRCKDFDASQLTSGEASMILNRLFAPERRSA